MQTVMINVVVFVLGFVFFCSMLFWLDKRRQRLKEEELNTIRKNHLTPKRFKTKVVTDGLSYAHPEHLITTFKYVGEYKPGVVYKDGDVVFKGQRYYVKIKNRLEEIGETWKKM